MTLHRHVHYTEIQPRTRSGPLSSSVKPGSQTMSMCVLSARAEPFRSLGVGAYFAVIWVVIKVSLPGKPNAANTSPDACAVWQLIPVTVNPHGYLAHKKKPTPPGPPWDPRHLPTVGS